MEESELIEYLKETQDYIEFSFYKNSSDIMGAISRNGIYDVLNILNMREIKKGVFECKTTWEVDKNNCFSKNVIIDISNEMIFITESLENNNTPQNNIISNINIEKEYGEILSLLKSKSLNSIEKNILTKVVAAFFN